MVSAFGTIIVFGLAAYGAYCLATAPAAVGRNYAACIVATWRAHRALGIVRPAAGETTTAPAPGETVAPVADNSTTATATS